MSVIGGGMDGIGGSGGRDCICGGIGGGIGDGIGGFGGIGGMGGIGV